MPTKTTPFNVSDYMESKEDVLEYLKVVLEDEDPAFFITCVADIAKSKGMAKVARDAGMSRQGLYKALAPNSQPQWTTVFSILRALGLGLTLQAVPVEKERASA